MQANKLWQSMVNAIVPWDLYYAMDGRFKARVGTKA